MKISTQAQLETRSAQVMRYLDDAARQAQAANAKLIGSDGKPRFAAHVEAEMRKGTAQVYSEAVAEFLTEADDWRAQAETHSLAAHSDPFALLDASELQRANLLAPLVKATVEAMPLEALAQRLEAVAVAGDMPSRLVYRQCAEARAATLAGVKILGDLDGNPGGVRPSGQTGRLEFTQALDKLRAAAVHPKLAESAALAAAMSQSAAQVEIAVRRNDPHLARRAEVHAAEFYKSF